MNFATCGPARRMKVRVCALLPLLLLVGCYVARGKNKTSQSKQASTTQLAAPPFERASGVDDISLGSLYGITPGIAPAAVRPDADMAVRRLLRQYRPEGSVLAQEIGRVEDFRLLLGGASEDFRTVPQDSYDATSLLASQKVAEEICASLIAPDARRHPGWKTILPAAPTQVLENVKFLSQRFLGLPTDRIPSETLSALEEFVRESTDRQGQLTLASYVPACVALSTDAEALLL